MKAKDLRGKNIEDLEEAVEDEGKPKQEEDAVSAAYESLSKRLDSLRESKEEDDSEDKKLEEAEEELEEAELEPLPGTEEDEDLPASKKSLKESDPLDEESLEADSKAPGEENEDLEEDDFEKEEFENIKEKRSNLSASQDLGSEEIAEKESEEPEEVEQRDFPEEKPEFVSRRSEFNQSEDFSREAETAEPDSLDDLTNKEAETAFRRPQEEDLGYDIPNLRTRPTPQNFSDSDNSQRQTSFYQETSPIRDRDEVGPGDFFNKHQTAVPRRRGSWIHIIILGILGLGVIGFTVYILKYGFDPGSLTASPSPSPTATPVVSPTPEPTPEVNIERGNYTVRVLNGTSTTGLAGTVTDKLKGLGYKTGKQGNATNSAFEQTFVRVKQGSESATLLQRLIQDLAADYQAVEGPSLEKNSTNDAEVIIGKK